MLFSALECTGGTAFSNMAVWYNNVDGDAANRNGITIGNTHVSRTCMMATRRERGLLEEAWVLHKHVWIFLLAVHTVQVSTRFPSPSIQSTFISLIQTVLQVGLQACRIRLLCSIDHATRWSFPCFKKFMRASCCHLLMNTIKVFGDD